MNRLLLLVFIIILGSVPSLFAEEEYKGTDFIVTFIPNYHNNWSDSDSKLRLGDSVYLFIFAEVQTKAQVTYHSYDGTPFTENFTINANQIYVFKKTAHDFSLRGYNLGSSLGSRNNSEKVCNTSFRLTTDNSVLVYGHSQAVTTSESFNVIPVIALGNEYLILTYNSDGTEDEWGGGISSGSTPSQFAIVASEDNTNVKITPKSKTMYNNMNIQNITLNKGEVYLVQSKITVSELYLDLSGTEVISDKPIAVFSGHQRAAIPYNLQGSAVSRDMLVEQLPPLESWSSEAIIPPFKQPSYLQNTFTNDLVRIIAGFDNTEIYIEGILQATLNRGEFLELELTEAFKVTATSSILVCTYKRSSQTENSNSLGDPLMQIVPSIEQYGNAYRFIAIQAYQWENGFYDAVYSEHFVTIIAPENIYKQINLDGNIINPALFTKIKGTNYYYAYKEVTEGTHEITASANFGLFVCGYGFANSYGFFSGVIIKRDDFEPPVLQSKVECFEAKGNVKDKKVSKVYSQPNSEINTLLSVDSFTPFATDVNFNVNLINKYIDGSIRVIAEDSASQKSFNDVQIPGFTVAVENISKYSDGTVIPTVSDTSTNNQIICKTFKLINYGKYPQTILSSAFKQKLPVYSTNLPVNFVLQPNQTKEFNICFETDLSDIFNDTLLIESPCGTRDLLALNFASLKDQDPPKLFKKSDPCNHYIEISITDSLKTDRGIAEIIVDNAQNIEVTKISKIKKYAVYSATVTDNYQDAYYTIRAIDSAGFTSIYTDTIPGFTVEFFGDNINHTDSSNSDFKFGHQSIGIQVCDSVKIRNYGNYDFSINDLYMYENIWFSIPLSQLPILLKPGETKQIFICYRPSIASKDTLRDTLKLTYNCLDKGISISGIADSIKIENGSRCQVNVLFESGETYLESFVSKNYPNPSGLATKVKFGVSNNSSFVKAVVYDLYGNFIKNLFSGNLNKGTFEVELVTSDLNSGLYFYIFEIDGQKFINTMVIEK